MTENVTVVQVSVPGAQGPRGLQGEPGATGPQGPAGVVTPELETLAAQASASAEAATTAAANAQSSSRVFATWTGGLAAASGTVGGEGAEVLDSDTGTHTDPVVGGTVPNAGKYTWSTSPAGWKRIGETGLSAKLTRRLKGAWAASVDFVAAGGRRLMWITAERIHHPQMDALQAKVDPLPDFAARRSWTPAVDIAGADGRRMMTITADNLVHPVIAEYQARLDAMSFERLSRLRKIRYKLWRLADAGVTNEALDIGIFGDSYTFVRGYYSQKLAETLVAKYADVGPGWVGFAWRGGGSTVGNGAALGGTYSYSANWNDPNWTSSYGAGTKSPDLGLVTSSVAGATLAPVTGPASPTLDSAKLVYRGNGTGETIRYRWGSALAWTTLDLTGTGLQVATLTPPPAATAWTFEVEVADGTVTLAGLVLKATTGKGVRIHKLASTGSGLVADWLPAFGADFRNGISYLGLDAAIIFLGTNDKDNSADVAAFGAGETALIAELRAAQPGMDILVVVQPENTLGGGAVPMIYFAAAARQSARAADVAFADFQGYFGGDPSEYGPSGVVPLLDADGIHPATATGGKLIADTFMRIFHSSL